MFMTMCVLCINGYNHYHVNTVEGFSALWFAWLTIQPLPPTLTNNCHDPEFLNVYSSWWLLLLNVEVCFLRGQNGNLQTFSYFVFKWKGICLQVPLVTVRIISLGTCWKQSVAVREKNYCFYLQPQDTECHVVVSTSLHTWDPRFVSWPWGQLSWRDFSLFLCPPS
jgi:hypothetical protein